MILEGSFSETKTKEEVEGNITRRGRTSKSRSEGNRAELPDHLTHDNHHFNNPSLRAALAMIAQFLFLTWHVGSDSILASYIQHTSIA